MKAISVAARVLVCLAAVGGWGRAFAQDSLTLVSTPKAIDAGASCTVSVSYACSEPRFLTVDLLRPDDGYSWHGGASVKVLPSSKIALLHVTVPGDTPPADGEYMWHGYLTAAQGDWQHATAVIDSQSVSVTRPLSAKGESANDVRIVSAPATAFVGRTYPIVIDFSQAHSLQGRYVQVDLLSPSKNWACFGTGKEKLPSDQPSGRFTVRLPISDDAPTDATYAVNVFIAARGETWKDATAKDTRQLTVVKPPPQKLSTKTPVQKAPGLGPWRPPSPQMNGIRSPTTPP